MMFNFSDPEEAPTPAEAGSPVLRRSRLQDLRDQTETSLALLEAAPRMLALIGPSLDMPAYGATLLRFLGFYRGMEPWLATALEPKAIELALGMRWRTPVLERDLLALGMGHDDIQALPACPAPPAPPALVEGIGMMFVFENFSRSAPVLARTLHARLGVRAGSGAGFFTGYGADGTTLWRKFGTVADEVLAEEPDFARAVAAANNTFLGFERWLTLS